MTNICRAVALIAVFVIAFGCERYAFEDVVRDVEAMKPRQPARSSLPPELSGPIEVDVRGAVLMALERNGAFAVQRIRLEEAGYLFDETDAAFDLRTSVAAFAARANGNTDDLALAQVEQRLSSGATIGFSAQSNSNAEYSILRAFVNQPVIQGGGRDVTLAFLRQAGIDAMMSNLEFRDFAMGFVAEVEKAYWDLALDEMQIAIYEDSLRLAERQLSETEERIRIGRLAGTELAAAKAEVALRREALINARSSLASGRLRFLRTLNPGPDPWGLEVVLLQTPTIPAEEEEDVEARVRLAMEHRPDLETARLAIARGEIGLLWVRDSMLPRLDLRATAERMSNDSLFGSAGEDHFTMVELRFTHTFSDRGLRSRRLRTELALERGRLALDNLEQQVQLQVRTALIEVERTREQVSATAATRAFREESLRAETEKLNEGRSTTLQVAQAQRDLAASQVAGARAVASHLKAITDLHLAEGSILERRGIAVGGR